MNQVLNSTTMTERSDTIQADSRRATKLNFDVRKKKLLEFNFQVL